MVWENIKMDANSDTVKNKRTPLVFLCLSLIFSVWGQVFIYFKKDVSAGIVFFLIGVVLFVISARFLKTEVGEVSSEDRGNIRKNIGFFLIVMVVAAFFRFYSLDTVPVGFHRDEAKASLDSYYIMQDKQPLNSFSKHPVYIGPITDNPAMYNYLIAAVYQIIGVGVVESRAASAFLGLLAVAAMYFLLYYLFGGAAAFAGGILFAAMKWHVAFVRIIFHSGFSVFILILVLYFGYKVFKERRWRDFIF
ncbi:MAG TPA: hypothetical protein ENN55_02880, partial [Firmicutes bacterium]|nr:hypothetical protein [Bacillota bacterium]